ncbi:endonuclease/exonuclease/phosphatase family protein [Heliobacterium mobile]|uniref:endonuclease/exonuclease/phosphatase family protein n=1 Tax=Heliobacterium mobile TaxID=28064 RepID=UPI001479036D|nr:endonuclease/exonuclease/phosphatase family protein [Heliobacterium mobile]
MNYLFWNTKKTPVNSVLSKIIRRRKCDIIALAEYTDNVTSLINDISDEKTRYYQIPSIGCDRIKVIANIKPARIKFLKDTDYYTILQFPHETLKYHIVSFVHFSSKMYRERTDFLFYSQLLKNDIDQIELVVNNKNTVIVGDFNMNPFEDAMVAASAFHAVPTRDVANRKSRKVSGLNHSMFYNPMWNLFGDKNNPPGTYYYSNSNQVNYFWHIFDQVLIRPSLINRLPLESIDIINFVEEESLVNKRGIPNISDHLPLFFTIV